MSAVLRGDITNDRSGEFRIIVFNWMLNIPRRLTF